MSAKDVVVADAPRFEDVKMEGEGISSKDEQRARDFEAK